jgi:hypothetical protein
MKWNRLLVSSHEWRQLFMHWLTFNNDNLVSQRTLLGLILILARLTPAFPPLVPLGFQGMA